VIKWLPKKGNRTKTFFELWLSGRRILGIHGHPVERVHGEKISNVKYAQRKFHEIFQKFHGRDFMMKFRCTPPCGDPFVWCEHNSSSQRHNAFWDAFFAVCAQHTVAVVKEAECLAGRRPADNLLMNWSQGLHVAVGFVRTHPAGVAQHPFVVEHTAKHGNRAETQKCTRMAPCVRQRGGGSPHSP